MAAPPLKRKEEGQGRRGGAQGTSSKRHGDRSPLLPRVPGHPVWVSRGGRRHGSQKHTMEQLAEAVPMVYILHIPVPQMVEQLLEVFRLLDTQMLLEQAIAEPKISLDRIPLRSVELVPQTVEDLVEVPTVLTLSSLQQTAEQIVDIPVPRGRGRQRFSPWTGCDSVWWSRIR